MVDLRAQPFNLDDDAVRWVHSTIDSLSLEEKIGQLFMVGVAVAGPKPASGTAINDLHVGNVFLAGRSRAGVTATRTLVDSYTARVSDATTHGAPLFVATDQEGGEVQVLQGPGFSTIPSALQQSTENPGALKANASTWGAELSKAGVNLNLAPVMGLVPSASDAAHNPPIGELDRNYGYTVSSVTTHANAFSAGMESAHVDVAIKHFPGLGRVTANTDTTAGVTDTVTTADDPSLETFRSGIAAGAAFVMVSSAIYAKIDRAAPAVFSPTVVALLREQMGFDGVIISDDLSDAVQVEAWPPGDRAVKALDAGVDMVLASANPDVINEMVTAVTNAAHDNPSFAAKIDAAATKVLSAKAKIR